MFFDLLQFLLNFKSFFYGQLQLQLPVPKNQLQLQLQLPTN